MPPERGVDCGQPRRTPLHDAAASQHALPTMAPHLSKEAPMFLRRVLTLAALCFAPLALGQSVAASVPPPPSTDNVANLAPVVVSGVQPGPGLWMVARGDHVLWILGTLSPLPRAMDWQSREVEEVIGQSQQILEAPAIKMTAKVGWLGKLLLLPSAYGARKNEDGRTLAQVLPPPLYARWQQLAQQYMPADARKVERWRPLFAAQELYKKALGAHQLSRGGGISERIEALAKQHGLKPTPVEYTVTIADPRAAIAAFRASAPNDITCLARTLDAIEQDMPAMTTRANAWATGDLVALRTLPDSDRRAVCVAALTNAGFAQQLGLGDVMLRLRAAWLGAARKALADNAQTFAVLPMAELLKSDGYLAQLKAEGYQVDPPAP
jgi:hypothetical protein